MEEGEWGERHKEDRWQQFLSPCQEGGEGLHCSLDKIPTTYPALLVQKHLTHVISFILATNL